MHTNYTHLLLLNFFKLFFQKHFPIQFLQKQGQRQISKVLIEGDRLGLRVRLLLLSGRAFSFLLGIRGFLLALLDGLARGDRRLLGLDILGLNFIGVDARIVFRVRRHFRVGEHRILDGLGSELGINLRDDLDALETALDLGRRGLDLDLARRQDHTKLVVREVNLGKGKDDCDLAIGLGVLRADPALLDVAGRVLDGVARGVDDRDLFRLPIDARQLVLANVEHKTRLLALGPEIGGGAVLPRAVLDEAGLLFVKLDRVAPGRPAVNLETNRVRLGRALLLGALFQHAALRHEKSRGVRDGVGVLGAKPFLFLGKALLDGPLVKVGALGPKSLKLGADFDLEIELLVLLDGCAFKRAVGLDVPLLAHVLGRRKLRGHVSRRIDPDELALAIRIDLGSAGAKAAHVHLFKGNVLTSDRRHFARWV